MIENHLEKIVERLKLNANQKDVEVLAVDLNDIYESSNNLRDLVDNLMKLDIDKEILIDKLIEIEVELDHINWHYKSFKKEIKKLLNQ